MGWRVNSQNYNLNRDYAKADAPEMQAMLRLLDAWDPVLYVDLHVTDGAQFEVDVSNNLEPVLTGDPGMQPGGRALIKELNAALTAQGSLPVDFYPSFRDTDDPMSGFDASAVSAALLDRVLGGPKSLFAARRNAFVEGLPDAGAHHAQHPREARRDDGEAGTRLAQARARCRRSR